MYLNDENTLCIPFDAMGAVEHLLFSKYLMYKYVYWHKRTRSATAMVKKGVLLGFKAKLFSMEDFINLDDESFSFLLLHGEKSDSKSLFELVYNGELFKERGIVAYDPNNKNHVELSQTNDKERIEQELWETLHSTYPQLPSYSVILDIPEQISFETTMLISDSKREKFYSFEQKNELFSQSTITSFTSSLRYFRLFVPSYVSAELSQKLLETYL
jgi:HD superfamily phosphohydrolase